jgi:hypothetical protein
MKHFLLTTAALTLALMPLPGRTQMASNELSATFERSIFNRSAVLMPQPQSFKIAAPEEFIRTLPRTWKGTFVYENDTNTRYPLTLTITGYSIREKILSFQGDLDYGQGQTRLNGFIDAQSGQIEMFDQDIELGVSKRLGGVSGSFVGFLGGAFEREPTLVVGGNQTNPRTASFYWFPNQISQPSGVMTLLPVEATGVNPAARPTVPSKPLSR